MRSLVFWLLFPFVIPQAIRVRRRAPRFNDAAGPNEGVVGDGRNYRLLAIGDSIVSGVGANTLSKALVGQTAVALSDALDCRVTWTARGRTGATASDILDDICERGLPTQADFIVLSVGVNDITSLAPLSSWRRNLKELLRSISEHSPDAIIAAAGIPPLGGFPLLPQPMRALFGIRGRSFDSVARRVVAEFPRVVFVSVEFDTRAEKFAPDGYHPSEDSYREFGEAVAERILEKLDQDGCSTTSASPRASA